MVLASQVKPFEALPVCAVPADYASTLPTFLAELAQQHGPLFALDWPHGRVVYMVGPEANRFVLATHRDHFSHDAGWTPVLGELFGHGLLNMDGEEHARHRKMMNPAFTMAYMARYLPIMNRIIAERTRDWPEHSEVDLYTEARKITFDVAAEALVGFHTGAEVDRLREWFYTILSDEGSLGPETYEQYFARVGGIRAAIDDALLPLIAARRISAVHEDQPADVLGMMVKARDDEGGAWSDEQLLAHLYILLIAGHETSTSLSAWLLYLLATHPDYLARVHAELDAVLGEPGAPITLEAIRAMRVLGTALTEAGRLYSPVAAAPRGVVKDFEFAGYQVPAGTLVWYVPAATHRLPHFFADPDRFDPDRFEAPREEDKRTPYALVPFGGGPRICIGVNMATVEIKAIAAHILRTFTLHPIPDREVVQVYYGVTGSVPHGIPVRVTTRA